MKTIRARKAMTSRKMLKAAVMRKRVFSEP